MKKMGIAGVIVLLGITPLSFALPRATFEDAVRMAEGGLIFRGTALDSSTEGKDAPIPKVESGAEALLYSTWRVRIDECYHRAAGGCGSQAGTTINIAAITGVAIEREGTRHREELITNSVGLAVTAPLQQGGSLLLFVRPSARRPGSYEIVPLHNGSRVLHSDRIVVELSEYDFLSEAAKALPRTEAIRRKRTTHRSSPDSYDEEVLLADLPALIQRIRGNAPDGPLLDPQTPQR